MFSKTTGFRHADAIDAGKIAIPELGAANGFDVTLTEDATQFTDTGLRAFDVIVFLNTDGEGILNASQRTAVERWMSRGGGIVGIHADANADRDWAWKGDMMGDAWFPNHPSGAPQFQNATVVNEDPAHPAMAGIGATWVRNDEWYNFTAEPRGKVHVLATLDENTYDEQDGSAAADDHPIAWCSNYDGGRHFYTALGHNGAAWQETLYRSHILGAIQWAAGVAEGDCGEERQGIPTDAAFDKVTLDDNTENPMEIAIAPDRKVYIVELGGRVKEYNPATKSVRTIGTIPVHRGNENGLLGIALDPGFATNQHLYLFYSAPSPEIQRISRFTLAAERAIDMATEKRILEFPHQRIICCHSSGSMTFGPTGDLFISTGDDTQHAESQGYNPIDDRLAQRAGQSGRRRQPRLTRAARRATRTTCAARSCASGRWRARVTRRAWAAPTRSRRATSSTRPSTSANKTRPEIYTMGHRNPFRISVDQETGWVYNGEVGPDANSENVNRGPRGYDEINQIRSAGNYGWPYCIADNKAYTDWTSRRPVERLVRLRGRPDQRLGVEHGPEQGPAGELRAAVVAVLAVPGRLPVGERADGDPDGPGPHGDRRPDLPLRRGLGLRGQAARVLRRQGLLRGLVARLDRDDDARRRRRGRRHRALHAGRRLAPSAGHRDGPGRRAVRARVGP